MDSEQQTSQQWHNGTVCISRLNLRDIGEDQLPFAYQPNILRAGWHLISWK